MRISRFNIIKEYLRIQNEKNIEIELLNIRELILYLIIRMKNFRFFTIFWIYFLIFKKIAPLLLVSFTLQIAGHLCKMLAKNSEISGGNLSMNLLQNLKGYCEIKTIFLYYLKIITKTHPKALCFITLYGILQRKNKIKIYLIIKKLAISKLLDLPHKYVIYTIKTTDLFLKSIKENKNKNKNKNKSLY